MLRDRYTFKMGYNEWGFMCSVIKGYLMKAPVKPRKFGEQAALLNLLVLKEFNLRLDRKLCAYKSQVSFSLKSSEALSLYLIYKSGGLKDVPAVVTIVNTIDKQI